MAVFLLAATQASAETIKCTFTTYAYGTDESAAAPDLSGTTGLVGRDAHEVVLQFDRGGQKAKMTRKGETLDLDIFDGSGGPNGEVSTSPYDEFYTVLGRNSALVFLAVNKNGSTPDASLLVFTGQPGAMNSGVYHAKSCTRTN